MRGCHESRPIAGRPFVVTGYVADEGGVLVPRMPDLGPCAGRDERACLVGFDHVRERKTGPCFPLTVVTCGTHGLGFTLYPHGHVPYGRVAVSPEAPDGKASAEKWSGAEAFAGTLFQAALDASVGVAWPREKAGGSERWWAGQGRRLDAALLLCGVSPALSEPAREGVALALSFPLLSLRERAHGIQKAPGYRSRGEAVRDVLERLSAGPCVLQRLLASGYLVGLWGAPHMWDSQTGRLREGPFRRPGIDPS